MSLDKQAKSAALAGGTLYRKSGNAPSYYAGRQKQLFAEQTAQFAADKLALASDTWQATVEGLDTTDFSAPQNAIIRATALSGMGRDNSPDDWRTVIFQSPKINYVPRGAKFTFAGNVWLAVNANNIESITGNTTVRRCNAVWYSYDYYGNIISEPFSVSRYPTQSNSNKYQDYMVLTENYIDCVMQYNARTAALHENSRVILGSSAYALRGLNDFTTDESAYGSTVHLMFFSLYRLEPNENDDMENKIAGGNDFSFDITLSAPSEIKVGQSATADVSASRCGKVITSNTEYPLTYIFLSSDESVATVDENGVITAVNAGECSITALLGENTSISDNLALAVSALPESDYVAFIGAIPQSIIQFASASVTAAYFSDGEQTSDTVSFSFSGAQDCYSATVSGNTVMITTYAPSDTPLIITASANGQTASISIQILGY